MNMKKLWKKFDDLSGRCYMNMISAGESFEIWDETFHVLMDIIRSGRGDNPNYAKELTELEESIGYAVDISGWLEEYLDELDMHGQFEKLENVCDKLLKLFCWNAEEENSSSDLKFRMSSALSAQGKSRKPSNSQKDGMMKNRTILQQRFL